MAQIPQHVPQWWADELYRPFGVQFAPADGKSVVELLDKAGIDIGCVQSGDHEYVFNEVSKYPDRLMGVCIIDPTKDPYDAVLQLEKCVKELEMRALKLLPTYHHFYPADERLYPLYEKAIELDIPVHFHMGWTGIIDAPMKLQDPILLDEVGIKFRKLKVIVAHLGYPWVDQAICMVAKHPNFYCDMAYWCVFGPEYLCMALSKLKSLNALDRVLYGSENLCTATFPQVYRNINRVAKRLGMPNISDEEIAKIMGGTAVNLYKIKI